MHRGIGEPVGGQYERAIRLERSCHANAAAVGVHRAGFLLSRWLPIVAVLIVWLAGAPGPCRAQQTQPAPTNGWPLYAQAIKALVGPQGEEILALQNATDMRWIGSLEPLKPLLEKNRKALEFFYSAALQDICVVPEEASLSGEPLNAFYTLIRLAFVEARAAYAQGRHIDAVAFAAKALTGAEDLAGASGAQERLAAVSLAERVLNLFYVLLNDAKSSEVTGRIHTAMKKASERWPKLSRSLAYTRAATFKLLEEVVEREFDPTILGLDPIEGEVNLDDTRAALEDFFNRALEVCSRRYVDAVKEEYFTQEGLDRLRERDALAGMLAPPMDKILLAEAIIEAKFRATFLLAALATARYITGVTPESLDELAPEYINTLPLDPFSGESFKYVVSNERLTLYSVGPDGKDEGGKEEWSSAAGKGDIIFHLAVKEPEEYAPEDEDELEDEYDY